MTDLSITFSQHLTFIGTLSIKKKSYPKLRDSTMHDTAVDVVTSGMLFPKTFGGLDETVSDTIRILIAVHHFPKH